MVYWYFERIRNIVTNSANGAKYIMNCTTCRPDPCIKSRSTDVKESFVPYERNTTTPSLAGTPHLSTMLPYFNQLLVRKTLRYSYVNIYSNYWLNEYDGILI